MCVDDDDWEEADDDQDYGEDNTDYGLSDPEGDYPECRTCRKPKYDCWCLHNFLWQMDVE